MSGFYDGSRGRRTYNFGAAVPVAFDTATVIGQISGPAGLVGKIVGFEWVVSVETTTNPTVFDIDTVAGLTTPFTSSIPASAADTAGAATQAELEAGDELPADTPALINSDAGAAAGDGYLAVTVVWY